MTDPTPTEAEELRALRDDLRAERERQAKRRERRTTTLALCLLLAVVLGTVGVVAWQKHRAADRRDHEIACLSDAFGHTHYEKGC